MGSPDTDLDPDHPDGFLPRVRVTKEIPLWGILGVIGGLALQAGAVYVGQQKQAEEQARQGARMSEIATDVRSISADIQQQNIKAVELRYALAGLEQRVRLLEARPTGK
jgi:hypothetical protein